MGGLMSRDVTLSWNTLAVAACFVVLALRASCAALFGDTGRRPGNAVSGTFGVELMGLEPTTPCLPGKYSSQLSYSPNESFRLAVSWHCVSIEHACHW